MEAKANVAIPARLAAEGYEHTAEQVARLARFEFLDPSQPDGDVLASVTIPGGAVQVLPSDAFDPAEAERRRGARREQLAGEIERAEKKLANERFVEKAPAEVVEGERRKLDEYRHALDRLERMNFRQAEEYLLGLELFGMRFGLDRMHKLMTVLGHAAAPLRLDPRGGHQRQVVHGALRRGDPRAPRAAHRQLHLAAPGLVPRADRGGGGAGVRGGLRRGGGERRARRRAGEPHRRPTTR